MKGISRILVIEDDVLLLLDLVESLARLGIEALPLTSAIGAAPVLLTGRIDALITDIELPGASSGLDLAHHCARLLPGLPIVLVSGGVRPSTQDMPDGAVFAPKPYRVEQLLAGLERQVVHHAA